MSDNRLKHFSFTETDDSAVLRKKKRDFGTSGDIRKYYQGFIILGIDIRRTYHRTLHIFPDSTATYLRNLTLPIYIAFGCIVAIFFSTFVFLGAATVFEAIRLVFPEYTNLPIQYVASIGLFVWLLNYGRSGVNALERAVHPEDYDLLARSPLSNNGFVLARLFSSGFIGSTLCWFLLVGPSLIAALWIFSLPITVLVVWLLLSIPFIAFTLSIQGIFGALGYIIRKSIFTLTTASLVRTLVSIVIIALLAALAGWGLALLITDRQVLIDQTLLLLQSQVVDQFSQSFWIPSNWLVFAAVETVSGNIVIGIGWVCALYLGAGALLATTIVWVKRLAPMSPSSVNLQHQFTEPSIIIDLMDRLTRRIHQPLRLLIAKEIRSTFRSSPVIHRSIWQTLLQQVATIAFVAGFGLTYLYDGSLWQVFILLTMAALSFCYALSDDLQPINAIDAEGHNIALFHRTGVSPIHLFTAKALVHISILCVFMIALTVTTYVILQPSLLMLIPGLCLTIAIAIGTGTIQIGSSAVFPRFNWEHYTEIGNSPRAIAMTGAMYGMFVSVVLGCVTFPSVLEHFSIIDETIMAFIVSIALVCVALGCIVSMVTIIRRRGTNHWEG